MASPVPAGPTPAAPVPAGPTPATPAPARPTPQDGAPARRAEAVALTMIYGQLVGARVRADWQYRLSFALLCLGQMCATVLDLAAIVVIFGRVGDLAGWSLAEVAFLYGTSGVSFAIADLFVGQVERVSTHIKQGTFDALLIRPLGPLFQLSAQDFALRRIGRLIAPALVLAIAIARLPVRWTVGRTALVAVTVASGTVIFSAIWVLTSSVSFWTVETQEIANSFTYGGSLLTHYPIDVLGVWMRRLSVVIPLAFVNYVPATWILGHPDATGLPGWAPFSAPALALAVALVARSVWSAGIRRYRGTGS